MTQTFQQLGVPADLIRGIEALGIEQPTEIQTLAIPFLIQEGSDLIAQAQTGTGKTAAFGLPLLTRIDPDNPTIQALIIAPVRELAKQIGKQLFRYTKYCEEKIFVEVAAGGDQIEDQIKRLQRPTQILVATPGRLMDLLDAQLDLGAVRYLILDEADEMISMGFRRELGRIFEETKGRRSTWLFSATFQDKVRQMVEDNMSADAKHIKVEKARVVNPNIRHEYVICAREHKDDYICQYLLRHGGERGLIFCRTRAGAQRLGLELEKKGLSVGVLQGDLSQRERDKLMRGFKKARTNYLIATDVAARGIDVEGLAFVIHHQLPDQFQYYTHRAGRTARAGKTGTSLCLIEPDERKAITVLENELGVRFKLVE
ncbi:DEAD/DEAH box helicase [Coraliomargarita parva]|uniref:DEAD/DEAH box helicase n=1 Tax=Coraliomargarita parva TaxID=3014050 RepID=UPI0022B2BFCD|nr:DEAD/DEAH box helicase [Coraliomargarita parva]